MGGGSRKLRTGGKGGQGGKRGGGGRGLKWGDITKEEIEEKKMKFLTCKCCDDEE